MINIMLLLAAVLFAAGVLSGSALHTQAVDRRYRQMAQLVRELRELEESLADQEEALAGSSHLRAIHQRHPN